LKVQYHTIICHLPCALPRLSTCLLCLISPLPLPKRERERERETERERNYFDDLFIAHVGNKPFQSSIASSLGETRNIGSESERAREREINVTGSIDKMVSYTRTSDDTGRDVQRWSKNPDCSPDTADNSSSGYVW